MSNGPFTIRTQWIQDPTAVPLPVNQILVQSGQAATQASAVPDTFIVTLGHLTPPFIDPHTPEGQLPSVVSGSVGLIAPVGRFTFSPERLREFHDVLTQVLEKYDADRAAS